MSRILKAFLENEDGIRRYIRRFCSNIQHVEDLLQETFLKAFAAELKTEIRAPKAFLYRVAKNNALADIRSKSRSPTSYLEDSGGTDIIVDKTLASTEDWIDGRQKLTILAKAVATLPPKCRRVFLMRRIDGMRYKQIAVRMGISVSAVEKHVANGLIRCISYLRDQGYDPEDFAQIQAARPSKTSVKEQVRHIENSDE